MYGTIARMKIKPGALELFKSQETLRKPEGALGTFIFSSDAASDEIWAVVVFESKETYLANAESPVQDTEYRQLRQLLRMDPEWHDGEVVFNSFELR